MPAAAAAAPAARVTGRRPRCRLARPPAAARARRGAAGLPGPGAAATSSEVLDEAFEWKRPWLDDPFAALGLPARADLTDEDVRAAWRRIAAATHPDRDDGGDPARFGAAAAAYDTLRTSFGRGEALADLGLARPARRGAGRPARRARAEDPVLGHRPAAWTGGPAGGSRCGPSPPACRVRWPAGARRRLARRAPSA